MIRFLIELLVRRTWFGQFDELYFVLSCLVMRCNFGPNLRQTRSRQHDRKCRLKSSQYTVIIPHRVIQLTTISLWVPERRLCLPQVNKFTCMLLCERLTHSARFSYATEGALFNSAQLSSDTVSALPKVWVLIIMTVEAT